MSLVMSRVQRTMVHKPTQHTLGCVEKNAERSSDSRFALFIITIIISKLSPLEDDRTNNTK